MSFRVSDGIGSGMPGRLTPLWEMIVPPTSTSQTRSPAFDFEHAEPDGAVVDEDVEPGLEHGAQYRRRDREVAVLGAVLPGDRHRTAAHELHRFGQIADAELRPLEVCDQRNGPSGLVSSRPDRRRPVGMILVRTVGEVEPRTVDDPHQRQQSLGRGGRRPDGGDDLRAAWDDGHRLQASRAAPAETPTNRDSAHDCRALPRSAAAGCTWRRGRSVPAHRS